VFHCGAQGSWDDGAIWFGSVFERDGVLELWYEGGSEAVVHSPPPMLTGVGLVALATDEFKRLVAGSWG